MSSPSSSSTSTSRPSPFSFLPFELVQQIIESSIPLYFHWRPYRDRQNTLLRFSLVSRLFHRISKPLLFAIVRVDESTLPAWITSQGVNTGHPLLALELIIAGDSIIRHDFETLRPLYQSQQHLTRLVIKRTHREVDLAILSQLNQLSSLQLSQVLVTASSPFVFQQLSELSIFDVPRSEAFTTNSNSRCFPSLSALGCWSYFDIGWASRDINIWLEVLGQAIGSQITVIAVVRSQLPKNLSLIDSRLKGKTLIDIPPSELKDCSELPYLRIKTTGSTISTLISLRKQILSRTSTTLPTLLYLPQSFQRNDESYPRYPEVLESFLEDCKARKIDVIFEEQAVEWGVDSEFSPDFCRRMKEKAEEESRMKAKAEEESRAKE